MNKVTMPDESCRLCGGVLLKHSLCSECKQAVRKICVNCGALTSELYHKSCFYQVEAYQAEHTFQNNAAIVA